MRKIKLYIASSLDGFIADQNGGVDWLDQIPNPEKSDYGYYKFYDSIDTTIQGYKTYKQILDWGIEFPYKNKQNYVLTRKQDCKPDPNVEFINQDPVGFIKNLKKQNGQDIWLVGGGEVNNLLLKAGLIDEMQVFVMPIILGTGIQLFGTKEQKQHLKLTKQLSHPGGVIELWYEPAN